MADREMTLGELVEKLHISHRARREYADLVCTSDERTTGTCDGCRLKRRGHPAFPPCNRCSRSAHLRNTDHYTPEAE